MEPDECTKRSPQLKCFSQNHGNNVILLENNTVAYRKASFANAVTVSEQPVLPGEIFLVEIEQTEPGWTGHMRLGLTQLSPTARLPFYSLPDLSNRGDSWICAITKHHNRLRYSESGGSDRRRSRRRAGQTCASQQRQRASSLVQETSHSRHPPDSKALDLTSAWSEAQSNGHSSFSLSAASNGVVLSLTEKDTNHPCINFSIGPVGENASQSNGSLPSPCNTDMHNSALETSPPLLNPTQTPSVICKETLQIENARPACSASGEEGNLYSLNEEPFVLSASESATRISNSIKESVSQLLEELALDDEGSPVMANETSDPPDVSPEFICGACLSGKANGKMLRRTQNGCSSEVGSSTASNFEGHCSFCQPSSRNALKLVESDITLRRNEALEVSCSDSVSNSIDSPVIDENCEIFNGSNANTHSVDRSSHQNGGVELQSTHAGSTRILPVNEAVSDVVAMVQEEGEASNEEDGTEEHYVSCLARLAVGDHIRTSRGLVPRSALLPSAPRFLDSALLPLPTDAGSRIGLLFLPQDDNYAEMHYIINGEDQGVFTRLLPYNDAPLYAVVDVYGTTKRVRIIQLYETMSLKAGCRAVILQRLVPENIPLLPLPPQLLQYLLASDG